MKLKKDMLTKLSNRLRMLITCSNYSYKSTSDLLKSPQVKLIAAAELETSDDDKIVEINDKFMNPHNSDHLKSPQVKQIAAAAELETSDAKIVEINDKFMNTQLCATMICDIYKNLRASEMKKRPLTDYMAKGRKNINIRRRALLVNWLVVVAETFMLNPETLYLAVNYIDRYLSGNTMDTMDSKELQLLGVACMMIASKYEGIGSPSVKMFCHVTTYTYVEDEVLQMEFIVLNFLKFELTVPTVRFFLRLFVCADQAVTEEPSMELKCMSYYLAELSLLDYRMLCFAPSMIAASSAFLARYILSMRPWNSTLQHYTLYKPSDILKCVKALHYLCCGSLNNSNSRIRVKYSQYKFKCVAKKDCPPSIIPQENFRDL